MSLAFNTTDGIWEKTNAVFVAGLKDGTAAGWATSANAMLHWKYRPNKILVENEALLSRRLAEANLIAKAFEGTAFAPVTRLRNRGKSPGDLRRLSNRSHRRLRNDGRIPPCGRGIPIIAAPACPGFCPSYAPPSQRIDIQQCFVVIQNHARQIVRRLWPSRDPNSAFWA